MKEVEFKVKHDPLADALYIQIKEGEIADTDEAAPGIIVDYSQKGEIIGIEVLQLSKRKLDLTELATRGPETPVDKA